MIVSPPGSLSVFFVAVIIRDAMAAGSILVGRPSLALRGSTSTNSSRRRWENAVLEVCRPIHR